MSCVFPLLSLFLRLVLRYNELSANPVASTASRVQETNRVGHDWVFGRLSVPFSGFLSGLRGYTVVLASDLLSLSSLVLLCALVIHFAIVNPMTPWPRLEAQWRLINTVNVTAMLKQTKKTVNIVHLLSRKPDRNPCRVTCVSPSAMKFGSTSWTKKWMNEQVLILMVHRSDQSCLQLMCQVQWQKAWVREQGSPGNDFFLYFFGILSFTIP